MPTNRQPRVAIIGAGMSGICTAAALRDLGAEDYVIYEKGDAIGGTWRDNTYPGLSCDIPSRYYSFTFAPNPDWTRVFSPGADIAAYLQQVVDDLGIEKHIRFGTEVDEAVWTEPGEWRLRTTDGDEAAYDFIVAATGILHHPRTPEIPGLDDFAGATFHSARWDHSVPLDGKRVAVIGTGSTGVQITRALAPRCSSYKLFQRTPQWVLQVGNPHYRAWSRNLLKRFPALNRWWGRRSYRFYQVLFEVIAAAVTRPGWQRRLLTAAAHANLRKVRDPALRERLRPADQPLCRRAIISPRFYELFNAGQAELVDTAIDHVEADAIVTTDGRRHEVDVIVTATGFDAHAYLQPIELVGPGGVRLSEVWADDPHGYRTVALPDFPNFFLPLGPHSPLGNQSLFMVTETQVNYLRQWIERWMAGEYVAARPRHDATDAFNDEMRAVLRSGDTIWTSGCTSWYLGQDGLPKLWPLSPQAHRDLLATPDLDEWELVTG